jgi:multisubunit Na+/H+ antiporter MnhF subunit
MTFLTVIIAVVAGLSVGGLVRVLIGPTIWDRLLGVSLISSKVIVLIVLVSVLLDRSFLVDAAIIYSLLGFLSSVLISRFIERRESP